MPDDVVLLAEQRTERGSGPAGRLRRGGRVPAVVYGLGSESVAVTVPARELDHLLARGVNTLVTLRLDGANALTLVRQVQRHPTRGELVHVDFVRVRTDVAVNADIGLTLLGEPTGVRDGGRLEQLVFSIPIEAMPQSIPPGVEVDVSEMELGDQLRVADVPLPEGVSTTLEPETLVAHVVAPRGVGEEGEEGEGVEAAEAGEAGEAGEAAPTAEEAGEE